MGKRSRAKKQRRITLSPVPNVNVPQASRRKLFSALFNRMKAASNALKAEVTGYKPSRQITRREALARIGVGVAAAVGASAAGHFVKRRLPFWFGIEKRQGLVLNFSVHDTPEALNKIMASVREARAERRPFKIFFLENAGLPSDNLLGRAMNIKSIYDGIRAEHRTMRGQGVSENDARNFLIRKTIGFIVKPGQKINPSDVFEATLSVELALEGVPFLPIEAYSPHELSRLVGFPKFLLEEQKELDRLSNSGAAISEVQKLLERNQKEYFAILRLRDKVILKGLSEKFDLARKVFPELKDEKFLRAGGVLDSAHRRVFLDYDQLASDFEMAESLKAEKYSLREYCGFALAPFGVSQKLSRLETLGRYFDNNAKKLVSSGHEDMAKRGFERALKMTQQEFDDLSKMTAEIKNPDLRAAFITNYLIR